MILSFEIYLIWQTLVNKFKYLFSLCQSHALCIHADDLSLVCDTFTFQPLFYLLNLYYLLLLI